MKLVIKMVETTLSNLVDSTEFPAAIIWPEEGLNVKIQVCRPKSQQEARQDVGTS